MNIFFLFRSDKIDKTEEEVDESKSPLKTEKKCLFHRLPIQNNMRPRSRFRNFSHVSEFGNGLDLVAKSTKKKDKIDEFLEKKRERNTVKRLHGRKKFN